MGQIRVDVDALMGRSLHILGCVPLLVDYYTFSLKIPDCTGRDFQPLDYSAESRPGMHSPVLLMPSFFLGAINHILEPFATPLW